MEHIKKYWYIAVSVAILLSIQVIVLLNSNDSSSQHDDWANESSFLVDEGNTFERNNEVPKEEQTIMIDIKGEVHMPGVYEVEDGSRLKDVVVLAGGFTEFADQNQVNLAQKVFDEMVIYIGKEGEGHLVTMSIGHINNNKQLNVNNATVEELDALPGIGPAKAEAIIQYRKEQGFFRSIEEIQEVPGIGEKLLENLRQYITIQ
ncbi:helix-hairpin-helix domain-containing protein [Bacillus salitolerans]|uniref:Helix-hairpin-helix domain-containing protein n=1 Tax=Bacillus salitolerans TaxID=1437434 RepID=A0ABW4LNL0_9BACI